MPDAKTYGPSIAQLSVSRITYDCDVSNGHGLIIPLGTIAEIIVGPVRALGLIARTALFDEETAAMGRLIRGALTDPFSLLKREFEWAWETTAPGEALAALATRHAESLSFSTPDKRSISDPMERTLDGLAELAKDEMRRNRDKEFFALLRQTWSATAPSVISQEELARLAA